MADLGLVPVKEAGVRGLKRGRAIGNISGDVVMESSLRFMTLLYSVTRKAHGLQSKDYIREAAVCNHCI